MLEPCLDAGASYTPTLYASEKAMDLSLDQFVGGGWRPMENFSKRNAPANEDRNLTNSTKLLEKYKELKNVQSALSAKKEVSYFMMPELGEKEFRVKMECIQRRREELEKKECELKESLIKFDQFFKDNDEKRVRAMKKISSEKSLQQQKQNEIDIAIANMYALVRTHQKYGETAKPNETCKQLRAVSNELCSTVTYLIDSISVESVLSSTPGYYCNADILEQCLGESDP
ncbi:unnamed protein product [Trichobilharzia regenti]|nr:unnamed protein product [Trichobilharzia regenti]